jgi:hypothetical protein
MRDVASRNWLIAIALSSCVIWQCATPPSDHPVAPVDASAPSDPIGTWRGHVEHADFGAGEGDVLLRLTREGDRISGRVVFGNGPVDLDSVPEAGAPRMARLVEGYPYPIYHVRVEGQRVRFHMELGDSHQDWCVAQRPRARVAGTNAWGCPQVGVMTGPSGCALMLDSPARAVPDAGGARRSKADAGQNAVPVECELIEWCETLRQRCFCKETTCNALPAARVLFDAVFRDDHADGSVILPYHRGSNLRLQRVRP